MTARPRPLAASVALALCLVLAPATSAVEPGSGCEVFPADNAWHLDVRGLPVHPRAQDWKRTSHAGGTSLHPDFGPPSYGIPYDVVGAGHDLETFQFTYAGESDAGPYPFGPDVRIEGGSDAHAIMIDESDCSLYELFAVNRAQLRAGSGAIFALEGPDANDLRPAGWTSADAAGLSIFAGLLRPDEVEAGLVDHAIRMTVACTADRYLWPARHSTSTGRPTCPPMGARFRLRSNFPMQGFDADARVILRAFKTYGLIVADNGSDWFFQGTVDDAWTNSLLDQLKQIPAGAFQAVDARRCRVTSGSAAFAYGAGCPAP
ncbi:MAG TPA: hypothetical protein VE032_09480 [Actinomycetota bacterium]|nr:hypothetical protein [Actinomycetota bacterium]